MPFGLVDKPSANRTLARNGVRGDENTATLDETSLPPTGLRDSEERLHLSEKAVTQRIVADPQESALG
jgi:hypothetical protein